MIVFEIKSGRFKIHWVNTTGFSHRLRRPAYISWYRNGQKMCESYQEDGLLHRKGGPAYNDWRSNGRKGSEQYFEAGKFIKFSLKTRKV